MIFLCPFSRLIREVIFNKLQKFPISFVFRSKLISRRKIKKDEIFNYARLFNIDREFFLYFDLISPSYFIVSNLLEEFFLCARYILACFIVQNRIAQ